MFRTQVQQLAVAALCALGPQPARAVPPPPAQVTANCEAPTYASDQLVCADPELLELDRLLGDQIGSRDEAAVASVPAGSDEEWFRRSRMCAFEADHRDCLRAAYCLRLAWLDRSSPGVPAACAVPAADYLPAASMSDSGFVRGAGASGLPQGAEIRLWGFVDHGNLYGDDGARAILGDWWGGPGPDSANWRFNLKTGANQPVGASFAVHIANDLLRDDVLRVFRADAEAGRATRVYLRGRVFTFAAPTGTRNLTGLRLEVKSSRAIGLAGANAQQP